MAETAFDKWLTSEPAYVPEEVDHWHVEERIHKRTGFVGPELDDGTCSGCGARIGAITRPHYANPDIDMGGFVGYWIMDEDQTVLWCEDCLVEYDGYQHVS